MRLPIAIKSFLGASILLLSLQAIAENLLVPISHFSSGDLDQWKVKSFKLNTNYNIVTINQQPVLEATSNDSASALYREIRIDLSQTPILNWRWRVEKPLRDLNEKTKIGDDYAARVYVIVDGGLVFWRTKAINYVWASKASKGSDWPNAFAGESARMIAVRSKDDNTGEWYSEKRDVRNDLRKYFGEKIRFIDAVAIMTDTDNSKQEATAYYGEIFFSSD